MIGVRSRLHLLTPVWKWRFQIISPSPQRQTEVKNRAVPQLAGEAETAAVGFYYGFADGQAHARAVDLHALVSSAVKFFEDERLLEIVDAGTAIGDVDGEHLVVVFVFGFRGDANRSASR